MKSEYEITVYNINEAMAATGAPMDRHESDLYVKVTPETKAIIERYEWKNNVETFIDAIDKEPWFDIPFVAHGMK